MFLESLAPGEEIACYICKLRELRVCYEDCPGEK